MKRRVTVEFKVKKTGHPIDLLSQALSNVIIDSMPKDFGSAGLHKSVILLARTCKRVLNGKASNISMVRDVSDIISDAPTVVRDSLMDYIPEELLNND